MLLRRQSIPISAPITAQCNMCLYDDRGGGGRCYRYGLSSVENCQSEQKKFNNLSYFYSTTYNYLSSCRFLFSLLSLHHLCVVLLRLDRHAIDFLLPLNLPPTVWARKKYWEHRAHVFGHAKKLGLRNRAQQRALHEILPDTWYTIAFAQICSRVVSP